MSEEKDDYSYWSENLHGAYLFYTLEVDKLNKENKRLREVIEDIKFEAEFNGNDESLQKIINIVDNTLKGGGANARV